MSRVYKCLTWNICMMTDFEPEVFLARNEAICNRIASLKPDICCLQECTIPELINIDGLIQVAVSGNCCIFVQERFEDSCIIATISDNHVGVILDENILVITAHLPSGGDKEKERHEILKDLWVESHELSKNVILLGDMNMRDKESAKVKKIGWRDAWVLDGSNQDKRWTWDSVRNQFRKGPKFVCRFDRVFLTKDFTVDEFQLIIGNLSDHYGIMSTIQLK